METRLCSYESSVARARLPCARRRLTATGRLLATRGRQNDITGEHIAGWTMVVTPSRACWHKIRVACNNSYGSVYESTSASGSVFAEPLSYGLFAVIGIHLETG